MKTDKMDKRKDKSNKTSSNTSPITKYFPEQDTKEIPLGVLTPEKTPKKGKVEHVGHNPSENLESASTLSSSPVRSGSQQELGSSASTPITPVRSGRRAELESASTPSSNPDHSGPPPAKTISGKVEESRKPEKSRGKKKSQRPKVLTDYYPVRRSNRKTKSEIEAEEKQTIRKAILAKEENGIEVKMVEGKGRGVFACREFGKDDFVVEYAGDLISIQTAEEREVEYASDKAIGCYMYYFQFKGKDYCVDATSESGRLGRLINHSKTTHNCKTRVFEVDGQPCLILVADCRIGPGEELLYDYGDRSKDSLTSHPWLAK